MVCYTHRPLKQEDTVRKTLEDLGWSHSFKCYISSYNQAITINEALLDSRGIFE